MNKVSSIMPRTGSTPGRRFSSGSTFAEVTRSSSEKGLTTTHKQMSGRNAQGKVVVRHQGGGEKRNLRTIDWLRGKTGAKARVAAIEYDPNRTARIALLHYEDGEKRYILAPEGLNIGDTVTQKDEGEIKVGNAFQLKNIPVGTPIHNIELQKGRGAQMVRSAGASAVILSKEGKFAQIKMPSGEIRLIPVECKATIGIVGNIDRKNIVLGKAGRSIHMGIRPTVRGTAQNPRSHPHGGGEGRSGEGMHPKTPWGKSARGTRTRNKKKYSNKYIVQRRKKRV